MSGYAIVGEWLVEETGECTCGTGGMDGYGHERGCGQEPVYKVAELLANYRAISTRASGLEAELSIAGARLARCRALVDMAYRINRTYPPNVGLASLEAIVGRTR